MNLEEYSEFLVKSICKEPDMIKVSFYESEDERVLEILVPEDSMAVVIGKSGKNAKALRTMIQAYAYIHKMGHIKVNIESF